VFVEAVRRWSREGDRNPDWTAKLYNELPKSEFEPIPIRLIPNYAWLNRGQQDMRVWLPLASPPGSAGVPPASSSFAIRCWAFGARCSMFLSSRIHAGEEGAGETPALPGTPALPQTGDPQCTT